MAFPVVESVTVSSFNINATAHLVAMPATVNSGDLLIVMFMSTSVDAVTTPGSFTLLHSTTSGGSIRTGMYYRIADGTEDGTTVDFVTATSRRAVAHCYRISTWHGTTPPEVGTAVTGTSTIPDPPTLTPSWGSDDTLWLVEFGSVAAVTVSAYPTNYTNGQVDTFTAGAGGSVGSARRNLAASSDNPGTFTISASGVWIAQTVAIRPSASGAATGTVAVTQDNQTSNATGVQTFTGTVAVTQAAQTSTASGIVANPVTGTVAVTQANQTSTASGLETISGTVAVTQANQTSTASGTETITGTVAVTQANQTSTASGLETITGTSATTQANQTSTASGTATSNDVTGTAAVTQANQTSTASGTVVSNDVTGSAAVTQADQTSTATGTAFTAVTGTVAVTQAAQTSTASGTVVSNDVTGTAAVTQADQTSSATGIVLIVGTAGITQADQTATASGLLTQVVTGTAAVVQEDQFSTTTGFTPVSHFRWGTGSPLDHIGHGRPIARTGTARPQQ